MNEYSTFLVSLLCFLFLFTGPKNYNGLLLRAEVLYRLGHFRSSLADAENAIKCQPTSCNVSTNSYSAIESKTRREEQRSQRHKTFAALSSSNDRRRLTMTTLTNNLF